MYRLGSLFDGIGGFPLAGMRAGLVPVWTSEIDKNCRRVTMRHMREVRQLGDVRSIHGYVVEPVEVLTFGSPCQDLSIANSRGRLGLNGESSGLFSEAIRIVREMQKCTGGAYPRICVWENVPGALSSNNGRDFQRVLEGFAQTSIPMPRSKKWSYSGMVSLPQGTIAWRVLDAQFFGLAQQRKRLFVVYSPRDRGSAEILLESKSLCGNLEAGGEQGTAFKFTDKKGTPIDGEPAVAGFCFPQRPTQQLCDREDGKSFALCASGIPRVVDKAHCVNTKYRCDPTVDNIIEDKAHCITTNPLRYDSSRDNIVGTTGLRRLTPIECERLMGYPDGWTDVCKDSARYKMLGNSVAVNVVEWLLYRVHTYLYAYDHL